MRYHVIGNEVQVKALAEAGLQGDVVCNAEEARAALGRILADRSVGTVLVSSLFHDDPAVSALIDAHEKTGRLPVIMRLNE